MEIKGHFTRTIYRNDENGYTVALFELYESRTNEEVTVVGHIGTVDKERTYRLQGDYIEHPKYGIQFKLESYDIYIANNEGELVKYFSGAQFYGIGKKFATTIVETLGVNAIERIKEDNDILDTVPKMTERRKNAILEGLKTDVDNDVIFLNGHHLSIQNIIRLKNRYHDDLMPVLMSDPYRIIREVDGIGFKTMDAFALSIGFDEDNVERLKALSETILMDLCMRNGDSYVYIDEFKNALVKEIGDYGIDCDEIMADMAANSRIAIEEDRVYHISQYKAESFIAGYLKHFPFEPLKKIDEQTVRTNLEFVQEKFGIVYQDKQLEAVETFFTNDFMILTGGPGTGKTTIVRGMIELCKLVYPQYVVNLIAPTGRAAKRLSELTDCEARTIHSLLLWDKETGKFAKDEQNPLTVDILIIDEFSMVDSYLFYNLLKACTYLKKLVIIGDPDQLPSVAMGAVLRDFLESDMFKVIKLEKIYRQKEGSDIISLAYDIKNDCCQDIPTDKDIRFIECNPLDIKRLTLQVVGKALENYESLSEGFMNVQVLAPKHMGLNGIDNFNVALQKQFNPKEKGKKEIQVGYRTFRENDKVIQLKNQPDDDVYNGDIGIVIEVIYANEDINNQNRVIVDFDGRIVEYTGETFGNITHAYCISVHKSQGSEYPIIIMPLDNEYGIMLQKRLIYTAVTRAYKSLVFIGEKSAFYKGITRKDHFVRKTTLKERLLENDEW